MKITHAALHAYLVGLLGSDGVPATALAALGGLGAPGVMARSAATTLVAADRGKVVRATAGSWALTLPGAAAVGAGWAVLAVNGGSGTITLTRAGSDLIDGAATVALAGGMAVLVVSTGSAWVTLTLGGAASAGRALRAADIATSPTDTTPARLLTVGAGPQQLAASGALRVTVGGTANARTLTSGCSFASVPVGLQVRFRAGAANTGATTIAMDGLTAAPAVTVTGAALPAGYIRTDADTVAIWDGTNWVLQRDPERGSNANGTFIRTADGNQTCILTGVTFGFFSADALSYSWTFPASFASGTIPMRQVSLSSANVDFTGLAAADIGAVQLGGGSVSAATRLARVAGAPAFVTGDQIANCAITATGFWY